MGAWLPRDEGEAATHMPNEICNQGGTVYKDTLNALQKLGLSTAQAYTLMVDLNIHAANYLAIKVKQRRQLEPGRLTSTGRRGVG